MDSGVLLLLLSVGVVSCLSQSHHGWKPGVQYRYEMRGRNVVGLHEVSNQFVGLLTKGEVKIQTRSNGRVNVQVHQAQQLDLHANLSRGWRTFVPDEGSNYTPLPLHANSFDLEFKGGVVNKMWVHKSAPVHEVNILKAIASLLQTDTTGKNLKKSSFNYQPVPEAPRTEFMTVEDTVNGEVNTLYSIFPLPKYLLQMEPSLARLPEACPNSDTLLTVDKTLDFSQPHHLPVYNYGFDDLPNGVVGGNTMGNMLARASTSRSVICGDLENFLLQSAVTTDKIVIAPHLYNEQKGLVASQFNLTLIKADDSAEEPTSLPSDAQEYPSLQYVYNPAESSEERTSSRSKRSAKQELSSVNGVGYRKSQNDITGAKDEMKPHKSNSSKANSRKDANSAEKRDESSSQNSTEDENQVHKKSSSKGNKSNQIPGFLNPKNSHKPRRNSFESSANSSESSSSSSSSSSDSDSSSSSNSMSSEENYWQTRPSLKSAPNTPLLPLFIGVSGNSIQASAKVNGVEIAQKLASYIGRNLAKRNSENSHQQTLSAFSRLVNVLQTMNEEQMRQATGKIHFEYSKASLSSQEDANKFAAWVAFRDAVAQAGTGPALLTIHNWMKSNSVKGEEAAEIVAAISKMAQYPSEEFVETFFNIMKSEEVAKHNYVNVSTVISFAGLVRRVFVSNETTQKNYPVHSFGLPHSSKSKVALDKYIPHFKSKLEESIRNGDSPSIQLYIWALGETSHISVLDIFEPYLFGNKPCSAFQRLTMIASLGEMARVYPKYVRPVMFKLYQNTGEKPEIRVAAVMQIMKTNPPPQLLQRIAQFTNHETSKQVNSAVKSAIESAARNVLMNEDHELASSARSAVDVLTKYEYGSQYSKIFSSSWAKENVHLGYLHELSLIQSEDSVFPSSVFCSMKRRLGGFENPPSQTYASVSSLSNLLKLISSQTVEQVSSQQIRSGSDSGSNDEAWSYEKVDKLLNLSDLLEDQVEGNIMTNIFGVKRFFAFDNHTIDRLPQYVRESVDKIRTPKPFNMTKMHDQLNLKISFPTAMGLPFSYVFSVPSVVKIGGQVEGKVYPDPTRVNGPMPLPRTANITGDVNFMYSAMSEGKMSFVTPFNHKEYSSGLRRMIQIRLPLKFHSDIDLDNSKLRWAVGPLESKKITKLLEYSTLPYTSIQNLLELVEPSSNEQMINVRRTKKVRTQMSLMGAALEVNMESQQKMLSWSNVYYAVRNHNFMTALMYPFAEEAINYNNFTLTYYGPKSSTARVTGALKYNTKEGGNDIPNTTGKSGKTLRRPGTSNSDTLMNTIDLGFDSHERETQMLSMAAAGIKDATSRIVDLSIMLEGGGRKESMIAAVAVGSSIASNSSLFLAFSSYGSGEPKKSESYKMFAMANVTSPLLHTINFKKTLAEDTKMQVNGSMYFGNGAKLSNLKWKMSMSKSEEMKKALKEKPLAQVCLKQMAKGYWVQPTCRNVTGQSGHMDSYKLTVNYQNIPDDAKTAAWIAYTIGRYYITDYMSEQLVGKGESSSGSSGHLAVEWKVMPSWKAVNISVVSPAIEANYTNVPLNPTVAQPLLVAHPTYSVVSRLASKLTRNQYFPICAIEGYSVSTFDNQTYPSNLGKCWYAMTHSAPKVFNGLPIPPPQNYSVLVRKVSADNKKEVMMILDDNVILLQPNQSLSWNGKSALISSNRVSKFWDNDQNEVAVAYLLPGNLIQVESPRYHMQVLYDGLHVLLQLSNSQRGAVRGLCGNFNGEKIDDFMSPHNCAQADPGTFVSSYAVRSNGCQAPSDEHTKNETRNMNSYRSENICVPRNAFRGQTVQEAFSDFHGQTTSRHRQSENHRNSSKL